jgi:hypothetical protein
MVKEFSGLWDRDDVGGLSHHREVSVSNHQVEEFIKVGQSLVPKVFQMQSSETI